MTTRIYLLRHGETEKNNSKAKKEYISDKNSKLNKKGKIQSHIIGNYFGDASINFSAIYSSPLLRAIETSDIITKQLTQLDDTTDIDFVVEPRLFSGQKNKILDKRLLRTDLEDLLKEIGLLYPNTNVLFVTHNHIIEIIRSLNDEESEDQMKVDNCSLSCIDINYKSSVVDAYTHSTTTDYTLDNKIESINALYWDKKVKVMYSLE
jgi:broad specificity phosphatase PhoE